MKQCALYLRVSLEEQVERFGLSSQRSELQQFASKQGYTVTHVFTDDGYSGADLGRPGLTELRDLVRKHEIALIIVHDPDRLARNLAHQLILMQEFEKFGTRLEFLTTPNIDTTEGRLLLNIRGVIAEFEREKIRERTMRGRREKARQGLIVGGRCPFGYIAVNGTYQIKDDQAKVVRDIFQLLINDRLSIRQIIERLNQDGVKPHTSTRWARSSVGRILRNELYTGRGYYNRRERIEPESSARAEQTFRRNKKTIHRWRAEQHWIPQSVPQIIDLDLFQAAQLRLKQNSEHCSGRPPRTIYLLRGILKCAACGRKYIGVPVFKDKYYRCIGRERLAEPRCKAPLIAAHRIESFIWDYIARLLSNPILLASKLAEQQSAYEPDLKEEVLRLENQIREVQRKEARLLDALLEGSIQIPGMRKRASELAATRSHLEILQEAATSRLATHDNEESLKARALRYCSLLGGNLLQLEETARQSLLRALVDDITLVNGQVTIRTILPIADPSGYRPQRAHDRAAGLRQDNAGQKICRHSAEVDFSGSS